MARFDGDRISSDGGVVLLAAVERRRHLASPFAACFQDFRDPAYVEHPMGRLVAQRVLGLALGYEDLVGDVNRAFHAYYPYGEEATGINQDGERMKFTGHERDLGLTGSAADDVDRFGSSHHGYLY